jgi:molecular chaperone DnaJ
MNDPYKVLGVSQNATDEEVKAAYREMAKKYHPDSYANNPLADLASEKMKEINEAYDTINKQRSSGGGRSSQDTAGYGSAGSTYTGSAKYSIVRQMINQSRIAEAQAALDRVPMSERDAEWHFLMGSVLYRKGWINEAYVNFQNAYRAEPNNSEYREAMERISRQMNGSGFGGGGFGGYNGGQQGGCSGCDMCSGILCAECLCNGCGGC